MLPVLGSSVELYRLASVPSMKTTLESPVSRPAVTWGSQESVQRGIQGSRELMQPWGFVSRGRVCWGLCGHCPDKQAGFQEYGASRRTESYGETSGRNEDHCPDRSRDVGTGRDPDVGGGG